MAGQRASAGCNRPPARRCVQRCGVASSRARGCSARGRLKTSVAGALAGGQLRVHLLPPPPSKAAIELCEWGMHRSAIPGSTYGSLTRADELPSSAHRNIGPAPVPGAHPSHGLPSKKVGRPQRPPTLWSRPWAPSRAAEHGENHVEASEGTTTQKKGRRMTTPARSRQAQLSGAPTSPWSRRPPRWTPSQRQRRAWPWPESGPCHCPRTRARVGW